MKKNKSIGKLLSSWTMRLAHQLNEEESIEMSKALKLAHMNCYLRLMLGKGTVIFYYQKEEGEIRKAVGTLCKKSCPEYAKALQKIAERNMNIPPIVEVDDITLCLNYWDIEKHGFRTYKPARLLKVEKVTIDCNKEI